MTASLGLRSSRHSFSQPVVTPPLRQPLPHGEMLGARAEAEPLTHRARGVAAPHPSDNLWAQFREGSLLDARGRLLDDGKIDMRGEVHFALNEPEVGGHV